MANSESDIDEWFLKIKIYLNLQDFPNLVRSIIVLAQLN